MRIGFGYDVHRLVENRRLVLGGIEIPYTKGLLGHSDADVLTHSMIDALFGALALGDIGSHFPDNAQQYKGISSLILLEKCYEEIQSRGYCLGNMDCTIVAQAPKFRPYIERIRNQLAETLNISIDQISVKATTEEGLGFTGVGEGISAYSVCLLDKKG